jgi:hypothetical protein
VVLDSREQIECLQTVDAEFLEEIVVGSQLLSRHLEMFGCEPQYFVGCVL